MSVWRDFQGKHIASGKVLRCACVWRVSGVLEKQQEGLQDTLEGVGIDGGASVGAAWRDDLGPLVKALDLTLSKKAGQ